MRLVFCNSNKNTGGVNTWTLEVAAALQNRGHKITIFGSNDLFIERGKQLGLDMVKVHYGADYSPLTVSYFYRFIKKERVEAVLVNIGKDLRTAGIAAYLAKIPVIQRAGLPGDMKNVFKVRFLSNLLQINYFCPCQYIKEEMLVRHPYINPAKTKVIHTAKQVDDLEQVGSPGDKINFITASRIVEGKGHLPLASVLTKLKQQGFDFVWNIAGKGKLEDTLKKHIFELGLSDQVIFHGWVHNVRKLLREADVFLLPSFSEGLPNSLLEAISSGTVPMATDIGGIHERWPEELSSFLIPLTDSLEGFEPALKKVLQMDKKELFETKKMVLEYAIKNISMDSQVEKFESFFESVKKSAST